ncbi:MAG: antitoxin family protein [Pirellulales bacterium]
MQSLLIEAVYENGVLRPVRPLPLSEHQHVSVSIEMAEPDQTSIDAAVERVKATAGMLGWAGDAETVERLAMDPEFGVEESP